MLQFSSAKQKSASGPAKGWQLHPFSSYNCHWQMCLQGVVRLWTTSTMWHLHGPLVLLLSSPEHLFIKCSALFVELCLRAGAVNPGLFVSLHLEASEETCGNDECSSQERSGPITYGLRRHNTSAGDTMHVDTQQTIYHFQSGETRT